MRLLPAVLFTLFASWSVSGQTYTISTFAGGGLPVNILGTSASLGNGATVAGGGLSLGDDGPATSAGLGPPLGVAADSAGNLYIADYSINRIRKVSNGVITTMAGNGTAGFSGDNGPATSAPLALPSGVAVDSAGNLYIADLSNSRIRKVSNGLITTVAGVSSAITIRDDTGAILLQDTITLPAMGHKSFNLTDRYAAITALRRGTLEFRTPTVGQISVLGLRFNATGAFSTIPALVK
jgi:hypothetical protein